MRNFSLREILNIVPRQKGAALVEAAISFPILMAFFFLMVSAGQALANRMKVEQLTYYSSLLGAEREVGASSDALAYRAESMARALSGSRDDFKALTGEENSVDFSSESSGQSRLISVGVRAQHREVIDLNKIESLGSRITVPILSPRTRVVNDGAGFANALAKTGEPVFYGCDGVGQPNARTDSCAAAATPPPTPRPTIVPTPPAGGGDQETDV